MTPELTPNEREIVFPCPKQPGKDFRGDHELLRKNTLICRTTGNNIPKEYLRYWEAVLPFITTLQEVMLPDYSLLHGKGYSRNIPKSTVATAPKTGNNSPETVPRYRETIFPYNIPVLNLKSQEMIFPRVCHVTGNNIPDNIPRHREIIFPTTSRGIGKQYSRRSSKPREIIFPRVFPWYFKGHNIPLIPENGSKLEVTGNDIPEGNNIPETVPRYRETIFPYNIPVVNSKSREMIFPRVCHVTGNNIPENIPRHREIIFPRASRGIGKQYSRRSSKSREMIFPRVFLWYFKGHNIPLMLENGK
ncbi:hypothetical protein EDB85DRAFT_1901248 [Lactarius pseudohatsudake]|nr:hypothetical protein EDB85DRAFT_1901248 [Lactarius pseudohatsudake]